MTVPITGGLIIIAAVFFFFFAPKGLYAAMIIFVPFSATAVLNLSWGGSDKGVSAWLFLGALWIVRLIVAGQPPWHKAGWHATRRARWGLLAFLGSVLVSLCVPLLLNGTAWVPDPLYTNNATVPLRFGMYNLTQTIYLAFGILLAIFVAAENCHSARLFYTLKLYVGSCAFAAAWGLFELWCDVTGHSYPSYIFNTNATESSMGYLEVLDLAEGTLTRISSVALEPSVLAQELLLAFIVLLVGLGLRRPLLGRKWDLLALALISSTLLASTSSTAYTGILAAMIFVVVALSLVGKPWKLYFVLAVTAVGAGILLMEVPLVGQIFNMMILTKFESGSGFERLNSMKLAAEDFLRYPLFGTGWHNVNSMDLVFLILANTCIVGLIAFGSFLLPVLRGLWKSMREGKVAGIVLFSGVALMVLLTEAAGLTYSAGYVWLGFGLGAGAVIAARGEGAIEIKERVGTSNRMVHSKPAEGTC